VQIGKVINNYGFTGQAWNVAQVQISEDGSNLSTPTAAGQVPISATVGSGWGNEMYAYNSVASTSGVGNIVRSSLMPLSGTTGSIGGSSLAVAACTGGTVSVSGATSSMDTHATPATYPGDGFSWRAYVSATGTVTVKVCNNNTGASTPVASVYNVRVVQ